MADGGLSPYQQAQQAWQAGIADPKTLVDPTGRKPIFGLFGQRPYTDTDLSDANIQPKLKGLEEQARVADAQERAAIATRDEMARETARNAENAAAAERLKEARKNTPEAKQRKKEQDAEKRAKAKADAKALIAERRRQFGGRVKSGAKGIGIGAVGLYILQNYGETIYNELTKDGDIPPEEQVPKGDAGLPGAEVTVPGPGGRPLDLPTDPPTAEQLNPQPDPASADEASNVDQDFYTILATAKMGGGPTMLSPSQLRSVGAVLADAEANPDDYGPDVVDGLRTLARTTATSMLSADGAGLSPEQINSLRRDDTDAQIIEASAAGDPTPVAADTMTVDGDFGSKNLIEGMQLSAPFEELLIDRIEAVGTGGKDIPRAWLIQIATDLKRLETEGYTVDQARTAMGDVPGVAAGGLAGVKLGATLGSPLGWPGKAVGGLAGGIGGAIAGQKGVNRLQEGLDPWLEERGINPAVAEGAMQVGGAATTAYGTAKAAGGIASGLRNAGAAAKGLAGKALPLVGGALGGAAINAGVPTMANAGEQVMIGPEGMQINVLAPIAKALSTDPAAMEEINALLEEGDLGAAMEVANVAGEAILRQDQPPTGVPTQGPAGLVPPPGVDALPPGMPTPDDVARMPQQPAGLSAPMAQDPNAADPLFAGIGSPQQAAEALAAERQLPNMPSPAPVTTQSPVPPTTAPAMPGMADAVSPDMAVSPELETTPGMDADEEALIDAAEGTAALAEDMSIGRPRPQARPERADAETPEAGLTGPTTSWRPQARPEGLGMTSGDGLAVDEVTTPAAQAQTSPSSPAQPTSPQADATEAAQTKAAIEASDPQGFWDRLNSPEGTARLATGLAGLASALNNRQRGLGGLAGISAGIGGFNAAISAEEAAAAEAAKEERDYQRGLEKEQRGYTNQRDLEEFKADLKARAEKAGGIGPDGMPTYNYLKSLSGTTGANRAVLKGELISLFNAGEPPTALRTAAEEAFSAINGGDTMSYDDIMTLEPEVRNAIISTAISDLVLGLGDSDIDPLLEMLAGRIG